MDTLSPATRRANRWLFAVLVIFAVALAVACFLWMRVVVRNNGGIVDPQPRTTSFQPVPTPRADFVLPSASSRLT